MPSIVAHSVRNCAITKSTFAAMSWSTLMNIDVNASIVATMNEAIASNRSSKRGCMTH